MLTRTRRVSLVRPQISIVSSHVRMSQFPVTLNNP
jgi:hypothetical protein